ncbi:hypothetical protein [Brunnivagina elsteri]|uniref:Uncharacterized protein n=1 Tax=Brunnivagina elsteri CCALA 953 TaxID=987040 RepID=A0A2A2TFJ4_9CYAN|nr:hypothetical protein [Calothrix elsteri]PAX52567.1 hypothetical protein CK510_18620 [Calothrix elsteri CCALA 953]
MRDKRRHGCLTAWLIFMIVANSLGLLGNAYFALNPKVYETTAVQQGLRTIPSFTFLLLTCLSAFSIACAIALFKWKKWGFYGFLCVSVTAFVVNLSIGISLFQSLLGFVGVALLYGVLNIGEENKGWTQLE